MMVDRTTPTPLYQCSLSPQFTRSYPSLAKPALLREKGSGNSHTQVQQVVVSPGILVKETTILCMCNQTLLSKQRSWSFQIKATHELGRKGRLNSMSAPSNTSLNCLYTTLYLNYACSMIIFTILNKQKLCYIRRKWLGSS